MRTYRPIVILSIILLPIVVITLPTGAADDIPEVFDYAFDDADPIKIYAGPVTFEHAGHVSDYGLACQSCHHTIDEGDTTVEESCTDCHTESGFIRGKEAEEMDEDELIEHYLNALHMQCIDCHKEKKIENRKRKIPIGCTQCHNRDNLPSPK